jgi:hypothetical protein
MDSSELELEILRLRKARLSLLYGDPAAAPATMRGMTREEIAELRDSSAAAGNDYLARLLTNHLRGRADGFEQAIA